MNIVAGLSGLKSATDLIRTIRDGLKAGTIDQDQLAGRIGEIYDYIVDSKDALVDAKDEIETLKAEVKSLQDTKSLNDSLEFDGKVYWIAKGDKWDGPFCPTCWDDKKKLVRLDHQRVIYTNGLDGAFFCNVHKDEFVTHKRLNVMPELPPI